VLVLVIVNEKVECRAGASDVLALVAVVFGADWGRSIGVHERVSEVSLERSLPSSRAPLRRGVAISSAG